MRETGSKDHNAGLAPKDIRAETIECDGLEFTVFDLGCATPPGDSGLTEAERAVAKLLLGGLSNREIANRRGVSYATIAKQVSGLYRKLGVGSRNEFLITFT